MAYGEPAIACTRRSIQPATRRDALANASNDAITIGDVGIGSGTVTAATSINPQPAANQNMRVHINRSKRFTAWIIGARGEGHAAYFLRKAREVCCVALQTLTYH